MSSWMVRSRRIAEIITAADQFAAWNTLRNRPVGDFGLIVTAEPNRNGDPIGIHTSTLMFAWGREADAISFIEAAIAQGLPDTTVGDRVAAGRINGGAP